MICRVQILGSVFIQKRISQFGKEINFYKKQFDEFCLSYVLDVQYPYIKAFLFEFILPYVKFYIVYMSYSLYDIYCDL